MDDGGLGENIEEHAEIAEDNLPASSRFHNDDAHLEPRCVAPIVLLKMPA